MSARPTTRMSRDAIASLLEAGDDPQRERVTVEMPIAVRGQHPHQTPRRAVRELPIEDAPIDEVTQPELQTFREPDPEDAETREMVREVVRPVRYSPVVQMRALTRDDG